MNGIRNGYRQINRFTIIYELDWHLGIFYSLLGPEVQIRVRRFARSVFDVIRRFIQVSYFRNGSVESEIVHVLE